MLHGDVHRLVASGGRDSAATDNVGKEASAMEQLHLAWEVDLGNSWVRYDIETEELISDALERGNTEIEYCARRQTYVVDLNAMVQVNVRTGVSRPIRCVEVGELPKQIATPAPVRTSRMSRLVDELLSSKVQVQLPQEIVQDQARLCEEEVREVFIFFVPGVAAMLYRDQPGQFALDFIVMAYFNGIAAFAGTPIHNHLLSLMRVIVHQAHDSRPSYSFAAQLKTVAEAFTDCQAVQGRVVEKVGLELQGVRADFCCSVTRLVGEYKSMALKMLAIERITQRKATDDGNPTHYENRLISDIGDLVGFNMADIRRAHLDQHAASRYPTLQPDDRQVAVNRFKELFDVEALLQAFVAEVNSFNEDSLVDSLPCLFIDWAAARMAQKHKIFDEETCSRLEISQEFALSILELLFFGKPDSADTDSFRGCPLQELLLQEQGPMT